MELIGSVRFGVVMLLFLSCLIGMFVMRQTWTDSVSTTSRCSHHSKSSTVSWGFLTFIIPGISPFSGAHRYFDHSFIGFSYSKGMAVFAPSETLVAQEFIGSLKFHAESESGDDPERQAEQIAAAWHGLSFKPKVS